MSLIFKPFTNFFLLENQSRFHPHLKTFVVPTRWTEFLDFPIQLAVSDFLAAKISFPGLSSPEEGPAGIAGGGSVVFAYFDGVQTTDKTSGHCCGLSQLGTGLST